MTQKGLTEETARFIRAHIDSISTLEVLLLLHGAPLRTMNSTQVNEALRSNAESVDQRLARLERLGLLASEPGERRGYRFAPTNEELVRQVDVLAATYRDFRERIIDTIYSASDPMQSFADAFRLKKETGSDS